MTNFPLHRSVTSALARIALAGLLVCGGSARAVTLFSFNKTAAGTYAWNLAANWYQNPDIGFPNGIDAIAALTSDIAGTTTLQLNLNPITLGALTIGDQNGSHAFIIDPGAAGSRLEFLTTTGVNSVLNKVFSGQTDQINAPVTLLSSLDANVTTGTILMTGVIDGGGAFTKWGGGAVEFRGINTYSGLTTINNGGNATSTLRLNTTGGNAIAGDIKLGNATTDGRSAALLVLSQSNQIADTAKIIFQSAAFHNSFFRMGGAGGTFSETIGGVIDTTGQGVIEGRAGENIATDAVLTINNTDNSIFNGIMRDKAAIETAGAGRLALVKSGTGTLTLAGGNIRYTGGTTINDGGTLILNNTTFMSGQITNNASTLIFDNSGDQRFITPYTDTTAVLTEKRGAGNLIIGEGSVVARTTNGSTAVIVYSGGLQFGMPISGSGIPSGTTIASIVDGNNITISLPATATATNGLTVTGGGTRTFNAPFLASDGTVTFRANTVFNAGLATDGANLTIDAGKTVTVNGTLNFLEGEVLTQNGTLQVNGNMLFSGLGALGSPANAQYLGSGSTNVTGTMTLDFPNATFAQPVTVGGAITINRGTTTLNSSGAFAGTYPSITLSGGGTLTMSSTGATDRIGNTASFIGKGGTLTYSHGNGSTETIGTLNPQSGNTVINLVSTGAANTGTLTFASLARSAGSSLNFTATDAAAVPSLVLGGANKVFFTAAPSLDDGIIGGWARMGNEWATYDTTNGVVPLTSYTTTTENLWASTNNIKETTGTRTLLGNRTINSLNIQGGTPRLAVSMSPATAVLTVGSGGILSSGANHTIGSAANNGVLTAGPSAGVSPSLYELNVSVGDSATRLLIINSTIANNGGNAVSLVKAGVGTLELGGTNTYTGKTYVNEGILSINDDPRLGTAPASFVADQLTLNGGTLRARGDFSLNANRGLTIGPGGGTLDVLTATHTFTIPSVVDGSAGMLFKTGLGNVTFTGASSNFLGGITNNGAAATGADLTFTGNSTQIGFVDHNNGTTNLGSPTTTGMTVGNIRMDGNGIVNILGGVTVNGEIRLNGVDAFNISGTNTISNTILFNAGIATISDNNTYLGSTIPITGAAVTVTSATALNSPSPVPLILSSGSFRLDNTVFTVADLQGSGEVRAAGTSSTLIVDTIFNSTFNGKLTNDAGVLGLTKRGPGVLTLNFNFAVATDYTGPTRIEGGVLDATWLDYGFGASSIGASSSDAANLVILSGAGLRYSGSLALFTDRSFTIGAGKEGAGIFANGTVRGATIDFGDPFSSPPVAIDAAGGISVLNLGGYGLGSNNFNLELPDTGDGIAVKKTGSGTWILTNSANLYKGETTILEGTLGVSANNALGDTNAGTFVYGGKLDLVNVAYTTQEDLYLQGGNLSVTQVNSTSSWAGTVAANALTTITVAPGSQLTLSGILRGHGGITQAGEGTLVLSGANTHANDSDPAALSGFFTVSAGKLILDYATTLQNNSKLGNNGVLTLGGGRLGGELVLSGGSHDEIVRATTLAAGANAITRTSGTSRLMMNVITRAGGATVNFSGSNIATTDTLNVNGILGGYATIAGTDWATNSGATGSGPATPDGRITAFTGYVNDTWAAPNNTTVTLVTNSQTNATTNTLRFNENKDVTLTLNGTNTISGSALLMTPNVGGFAATIDGTGSLRAGGSAVGLDLVLHQYDAEGLLRIAAPIGNVQTDVVRTNTVAVSSAVITVGVGNTAGVIAGMTVAGPGVPLGATVSSVNAGAGTVTISASATAPIGSSFVFGLASGLTKNGPGTVLLTGASTYSGVTALNDGVLSISSIGNMTVPSPLGTGGISVAGALVFNGGTLDYNGQSATTNRGFTANFNSIFNVSREDAVLRFSGGVAGADAITKLGEGTLTLAGSATAVINYTVDQGVMALMMNGANDRFASSLSTLTTAGGTFKLLSDPTASRSQNMAGGLVIRTGASEVRVTSDGVDGSSNPIVTTLILGDPADPSVPTRQAGGTVLFVEDSTGGGDAHIRLHLPGFETGRLIPWAAYLATSNSQPGVNDFAFSPSGGELLSADAVLGGYDIGSSFNDPANWTSILNPSEGPAGAFNGSTGGSVTVNTLRYWSTDDSLVTVSGTLTLESGAIMVANLAGTAQKTLTGGAITSDFLASDGTRDLILHNYNTHNTFTIASALEDKSVTEKVNLVQTGIGTTALSGTNTYTGNTYVHGGVLRLDSVTAIPGGIGTGGGTSHIVMEEGVIGLNFNDFTRSLGAGVSQVEFTGSGGFAAFTTDRSVNLGGASAQLTWGGTPFFLRDGSTLILGSRDADKTVDFLNPIALGYEDRFVRVQNGSDAEDGMLTGALSGIGGIVKIDTGTLRLPTANTHQGGVTLANGTLITANNTAFGTGVLSMGTTENTQPDDALILKVETPLIANNISVGALNSQGLTSIDFQTTSSTLSGSVALGKNVFVSPSTGLTATLSGAVTGAGGISLTDGGTLRLEGANSYGSSGGAAGTLIDGATIVRAGTLIAVQATSLGVGTLELGDAMNPVASPVDRATDGVSVTVRQGSFDPLSNGFISFGGPGAFLDLSSTFDGVTYGAGDLNKRILIKDEDLNPERNGIYQIVSVDTVAGTMDVVRVADLDVTADMTRGRTVSVTAGSQATKTFFITGDVAAANTNALWWKQDVSNPNPNVALLVAGTFAAPMTNAIDINDTNGTGTTTIGFTPDVIRGTTTLSGAVTLQSQIAGAEVRDLFLTAEACAELILSGAVTESELGDTLNLIKIGTGTVTLAGPNSYDGFTRVDAGVLKLDNPTALGTGNLNINGGVVGLSTASGNLVRTLGTGAGQVQWSDSGGFAAFGTDRTIDLGAAVTWGTTAGFVATGDTLVFGSEHATAKATLLNDINLGAAVRTVQVDNGPATTEGGLSGVISGGAGGSILKTGHGALLLGNAANSFTTSVTVQQGTLQGRVGGVFGAGSQAVNVGNASTLAGDVVSLEFLADPVANVTNTFANNVVVGNNPGTYRIDATNGPLAATDVILSGTVSLAKNVFVGPDAGAKLRIDGAVSGAGRITVVDGGTVILANSNTYGTSGGATGTLIDGGTTVRSGAVEARNATALGTTNVELGDATRLYTAVDRASNGTALSDCGAVFTAGTFTNVDTTFDGFTYTTTGARLLIKDELDNPERNGIYQITAISGSSMTLTRVGDFNEDTEMGYGSQVPVTNGTSAGTSYFLSASVGTVNISPVTWQPTATNPNVALLVGTTGLNIANTVDLNATSSTGTTTIGGASTLTTGSSTFSGNVTMQSQDAGIESLVLDITSSTPTGNGIIMAGVISTAAGNDLLQVRKVGTGVAELTAINTYTNGTILANGTLQGTRTATGVGSVFGMGAISVGTTTATQTGDVLKLEFLGNNTGETYTVPSANNIIVGNQNATGTTSIDATNGTAAAGVSDVDILGTVTLGRSVFLGPDANATLQLSGIVSGASGGVTVVDGGTVRLTNSSNTYGSSLGVTGTAIDGGTIIRNGTIEVSAAGALGTTTIELGDARNNLLAVDRASNGVSLSDSGALFAAGTFTGVDVGFGGGSYGAGPTGTRLLVKDEVNNPERNGIYEITAAGSSLTLVRVGDFNDASDMIYGSTVQVTNGVVPNQQYFLTGTVGTPDTNAVLWRDTASNPNVALLAASAITIANNIDLNASGSTGTTTLGSVSTLTTGDVAFSGTITLQDRAAGAESLILDVTSDLITTTATGVTLSNVISDGAENLQLRKVGAGVATLTGDNTYDGGTLVNAGVLLVNNTAGSGTGIGTVTVSGTGTVLGGTGSISGLATINTGAILQPGSGVSDANAVFDSATESLAFTGGLTLGAGSTAVFRLNGATAVTDYDQILVTGGTLDVSATTVFQVSLGFTPSGVTVFNLLDWNLIINDGNMADQVSFVDSSPALWDVSNFTTAGTITYIVPEPGRTALILIGVLAFWGRRRRR